MLGLGEGFPRAGGSGRCLPVLPFHGAGAAHGVAGTLAWWSPPVPGLPPSSSLRVSPRRWRQRREGASLPQPPAGLRRQCLRCATAPWLVCARAGIALHGVLDTLGLCFKFQGHEPFPGKN